MSIPFGYGDSGGPGHGGYGAHQYGYGHALHLISLQALGGSQRPDLGGENIRFDTGAANSLPVGPYTVRIGGQTCYSGISGQASDIEPDSTRRYFEAVLPHLFGTHGAVDVEITHATGTVTYSAVLWIVKYTARSSSTLLATRHPRALMRMPIPVPRS